MAIPQRRLFTSQEYLRMAEAGIFEPKEPIELIRGEILVMSPEGPPHAFHVGWLMQRLYAILGRGVFLWCQSTIVLDEWSVPEPDIAVLRAPAMQYKSKHPGPADMLILIEVAQSSLRSDRRVKAPLYAEAGVVEYWIVDVAAMTIERYTEPGPKGYGRKERVGRDGVITPVAIPGISFSVGDLLGAE